MSDNFYMSGLESGWFSQNFEDFHLFGYVGDRERLGLELKTKSMLRRLVEVFAPRVNIGTILKALTNFDLLSVDPKKTLAAELINLVNEKENSRKLTQLLELVYKRGRKKGTFFERVSKAEYNKRILFAANFNSIQDRLVTVAGQLLHRSAVPQFSRGLAATLGASKGEWLFADFPPHGLVETNSRFNGKVLLLRDDPGFTKVFSDHLPFCTALAWYPYVRVTGFFDASRIQTDILPSLSVSLVEYRRPKVFPEVRASLLNLAVREIMEKKIYLDDWSDLILFGYLVPLLFKGSNYTAADADVETSRVLREYRRQVGNDLPQALVGFYDSLPHTNTA